MIAELQKKTESQQQEAQQQENNVKPNFLAIQTPSNEIQGLKSSEEKLESENSQKEMKYKGLTNKGATCYMNSILQSLFMTPDFRKKLYDWKYNEEEYKQEDCIPYQLQKIFSKLQTHFSDFIDTTDLIKSFQWDQYQAFEQHDVQEFIRILFDAIEDTLLGSEKEDFIREMYQGKSTNYVKCTECDYQNQREEIYNDIIVTVKNIFDKIYNESLQKGLQQYLKPEILTGDNAYFCEKCNKKVTAIKGCKFEQLPKILTIILNRFTFDFFTMQRIKLNDFVNFPFVLNMNDYINGYDGIKNKLPEENVDPKYFENDIIIKPTKEQIQKSKTTSSKRVPYKKPEKMKSTGTKDFIKNMRQQNKNKQLHNNDVLILEQNEDKNLPPKIIFNKIGTDNNKVDNKEVEEQEKKIDTKENEQKQQNNEKQNESSSQNDSNNLEVKQNNNKEQSQKMELEQEHQKENEDQQAKLTPEEQETQHKEKLKQERQQMEKEMLEAFNKQETDNQEKIKEYQKDGKLVYELFSILIHTGVAYGGHYYALIKSFEDNQWYNFNDTRVTQFDVRQIEHESQGGGPKNAYMLFYRQVGDTQKICIGEEDIPPYIKEQLKEEKQKMEEIQVLQQEKSQQITIRMFFKLDVKLINISKNNTYNHLLEKTISEFKITQSSENVRLRAYKPQLDTMQEPYTGKENASLEELKIGHFKNLCIEIKSPDEEFESYDNSTISLRICRWKDNISSLDERYLEFEKMVIQKDSTIQELKTAVSGFTQIEQDHLSIAQKHQSHGFTCAEVITIPKNNNAILEDLNIFENSILYVEEVKKGIDLNWPKEFETEQYRVAIKFNSPYVEKSDDNEEKSLISQEFPNTLVIDSRLTVTDLKQQICSQLQLNIDEIIMRRGGRQGQEIKEGKPTSLKGQHFVNGSSIFLEFGRPAKEGEYRLIISFATPSNLLNDTSFHQFQEVGEFPISGNLTAYQAGEIACKHIKGYLKIDLDPKFVRLRERISNRLSKVYRNRPLKDQQLIDKKMIAVEKTYYEQAMTAKEHLVYVRIWNQQTWALSERFELIVQKCDSGFELAQAIYEVDKSIEIDHMEATRINAIWNFNKYDLLSSEWNKVNNSDIMLGSQPFHIMNDGYMLVIKDSQQQARELTEDEIQKMGVILTQNNKKLGQRSLNKNFNHHQPKEKALQITVKKKMNSTNSEQIKPQQKEIQKEQKQNEELQQQQKQQEPQKQAEDQIQSQNSEDNSKQ